MRRGLLPALALAAVAAEWLRAPATGWVIAAALLAVVALAALRRKQPWLTASMAALAIVLGVAQHELVKVGREWPAERERRVSAAFQRLQGELRGALHTADLLAANAIKVASGNQSAAFAVLSKRLPRDGAEAAVVILQPTGVPWAWAGRHRLAPTVEGDSLAARFSSFYATLESRRHSPSGQVAVASILLWADSAVPRPDRSLASRFGDDAGVQLRVYAPGTAPESNDIFEYTEPTTAGERLLFSVQPVPPVQSVAAAETTAAVGLWIGGLLLLLLLVALAGVPTSLERFAILAVLLWCAIRAPLGDALGFEDLFSPGIFRSRALAVFSASAGHLLLGAAVVLLFAVWLGHHPRPRSGPRIVLALVLLIAAPYLVSALGQGIQPPIKGVSTVLWLTWQIALTLTTSALIALAAALLRSSDPAAVVVRWRVVLGALIAVVAAAVGVVTWSPAGGWPEWYTFLWFPALVLVALPAPRWTSLFGMAIVAGTAAALVTWGAEIDGRISAAQRDLARLGDVEDPLAIPYLQRFGDQILRDQEPVAASELFLAWRGSFLAGQEYPVRMALWDSTGGRRTQLELDSLDLPTSLIATLVNTMPADSARVIIPMLRVPGRHYLLLQRLPSGRILSVGVGPRSRLMAPARIARLLREAPEGPPLYELALSPPFTRGLGTPPPPRWHREGSEVRSERTLELPTGNRHVHATIRIRPLSMLAVRGALLVSFNLLLLSLLWLLATIRPGVTERWWGIRRLARSFQLRLALTLALFCVAPAVGFTIWGLGRLQAEADRTRDLLIVSVLRDAVLSAGGLLQEPGDYLLDGLGDLSNRFDGDLVLYSGGRLIAASAPILEDLSLVEPLIDARVFQRLALGDELELTRQATTYIAPVRVGYRVAQAGPPGGIGILATPQLAFDWSRNQDQQDLKYVLVLALLAGLAAALVAAQLVARALSRPVADLRRSARALGEGAPLPAVRTPPIEFEQVFSAFTRMASDIQASQAALESARQRTAAVLAQVATGVVALDPDGRILIANARARQLLAASLEDGSSLSGSLGRDWRPLLEVVHEFLRGGAPVATAEVDVGGRSFRLQLARLGSVPGGSVLAVDDLTEVTQAARVLAWGEMARQVAHEIKNPLTPIRLGMQHLLRVRRERPEKFEQALEETAARILAEIDRLDTIARGFSRFGLPGSAQPALEQVDLAGIAHEVAGLYRLASEGMTLEVAGEGPVLVPARRDEVKEVLGNLIENSRNAGARVVTIQVAPGRFAVHDDGLGIAPEQLSRIFEPRFSTTTSGSGLGLAIVRRLVEGWGARIDATSDSVNGTTLTVRW
jgi:signal transduction histidine kinase